MAEQENEQVSDQASSEVDDDEDPICSESASQVQVDQEYTQACTFRLTLRSLNYLWPYTHNTERESIYVQ